MAYQELTQTAKGNRAIVTGANSGIGFFTARALAVAGFDVTLAVRNVARGNAARARIADLAPDVNLTVSKLDLSSLNSIREFAAEYIVEHGSWDALINNAGAKLVPERFLTDDGFEWHFGVNHLGHFALNGLLLSAASAGARIVTVSSLVYRTGRLRFHDLRWDHGYRPGKAYAMSKLAQLIFAAELDRRLKSPDYPDYPERIRSIAVHPGFAKAEPYGPSRVRLAEKTFAQSAEAGAQPSIYAALEPTLRGGEFIGPSGRGQLRGEPKSFAMPAITEDPMLALRLWRISNQLTRVTW